MAIYHVNLGFAALSDPGLDAFAENVIAKLTGNGAFPTPPVPPVDLQLVLDEFTEAMANAVDGGKAATLIKNAAREVLVGALREDAIYVQVHGANDPAIIIGGGFEVSSTNHASAPLSTPVVELVSNGITTTLALRVTPIRNAKSYEVQTSADGGLTWHHATTSSKARPITVSGLTPGTTYQLQVRAVGGTTGFSGWSDPVSHMAT
jgi:hypothetical protein